MFLRGRWREISEDLTLLSALDSGLRSSPALTLEEDEASAPGLVHARL
jgi:hypothetical protein